MSSSSTKNRIVVQVLVPRDVAEADRSDFESAAVEFLFGIDRPRAELNSELVKRGVNLNALAAASTRAALGICPDPAAYQFVPSRSLARHATAAGVSLTAGGAVQIEFEYGAAKRMEYPSNVLYLNLKLPAEVHKNITGELTGDIVTSLFGDCELPSAAQSYLDAHGVDLHEIAHRSGAHFRDNSVPPTTRVNAYAAEKLKKAGLNVDQFGKIQIKGVAALA